ncbi:MAG: hypothetical protein GF317_16120 [Candidatus Lokiarchaeota archaeon]|nr:hypothetical protein [Candidatus Lokiarchaeota archaeon]MBD3201061.1 hypothetical protein [Candidatus Lokiarchaeota archaeon]
MQKKFIVILVVAAVITGGIFGFGIVGYATYGVIDESYDYVYTSSGQEVEEISLGASIADIEIKYNKTNMPSSQVMHANLKVNVEGIFLKSKTYSDFFQPIGTTNNSAVKSLTFYSQPQAWFDPSKWFMGINNKLTIILRTDLKYNISASLNVGNILFNATNGESVDYVSLSTTTGNTHLLAPNINITDSLTITTTTGSTTADLKNVIFSGSNIDVKTTTGSTTLISNNVSYLGSCVYDVRTITGDANLNIVQNRTLSGDITGSIQVTTGAVRVNYIDNSVQIGAKFTGSVTTGGLDYTNLGGFGRNGNEFQSLDYIGASNTYTLSLSTTTGKVFINALSV